MATKQIQKTRTTKTKTKTAITQRQSLEVVQLLLYGGLSSLAYLRGFFAEKAFDGQKYSAGSRLLTYRDYVDGTLPEQENCENGTPTNIMALRRTRSKRADAFLDWLEEGAFVALRDGRLRALQIHVHTDPDHRERVVETYTFTIKYHLDGQGGQMFAGVEFDSPGKEGFTVEATTRALQDMLRHVIVICDKLPELPEQRFISMALFYPEDSSDIEVRGFEPSTIQQLLFAQADGWGKRTEKFDDLRSAFHSTSFRVSHLGLDQTAAHGRSRVGDIPSGLEYVLDKSKESDIADMLQEGASKSTTKTPTTLGRTPSTVFPEEAVDMDFEAHVATPAHSPTVTAQVDEQEGRASEEAAPIQDSRVSSRVLSKSIDTQSNGVPRMRKALQLMLNPEHLSQGDTQTQALAQPLQAAGKVPGKVNGFATPLVKASASLKLELLPDVFQRLEQSKAKLKLKALRLAGVTATRAKKDDIILCQCGHGEEEDIMISCSFCGAWQHLHCYGFTGSQDPRIPDDHVCYQCLFGGYDEDVLHILGELALRRRAMSFALQYGLQRDREDLAKSMGLQVSVAKDLLVYLLNEGFVTSPAEPRRSTRSSNQKYVATYDWPTLDRLQHVLFDPLTHIGRFYATTSSLSTDITRQLRALRSTFTTSNSPSPNVVPLSSSRRSQLSMTPSGTRAGQHEPLLKRPLDADIFSTPAKRRATATPVFMRFKSVQTMGILNVDGKSSPAI